jgi:hypothetical protein
MNHELNKPNPYFGEKKGNSHVLIARKDIYNGIENPEIYEDVNKIPKSLTFDQIVNIRKDIIQERKDLRFAEIPDIISNSFESYIAQLNHEELHPVAIELLNLWFPNNTFDLFDIQVEDVVVALQYYNFENELEFDHESIESFWISLFKLALKLNHNHESQKNYIQESLKDSLIHGNLLRENFEIKANGGSINHSRDFVKSYHKMSYQWNIDLNSTLDFVRLCIDTFDESAVLRLQDIGWAFSSGEDKYEQLRKILKKTNEEIIHDFLIKK